jgi:serine/threonine protein kinase/formylglycine-generating enzyme required for sulfatase activity
MPKDKYENSTLDGRYHLQRLLDSGSFGAVYEARDTKLGRIVAVKILFEKDETAFRKEAKLAVQFDHPNVVKVFDYGADSDLGVGYIVMEFLKGCRLDQLITQHRGRVPDSVILRFADQIGAALQLAHERNLIHRDLKPQNVMLVEEGTLQERFVLLDLGLASQMNSTSTLRNQTLDGALSPRYASPEQMGQETVDYRSDIYSFGTMLYELFTGEVPFVRDQILSLMMAICSETPPSFQFTAPNRRVPSEVEVIVQHCLSKKADERPESIRIVRSRILAAFGADTAMPPAVAPGIKRSEGLSSSGIPLLTGTMQPPILDGNSDLPKASSAGRSDWQSSVGRDQRSEKQSGPWLAILASIVVLLPILYIVGPKFRGAPTPTPIVPHSPGMRTADEIQISAGGSGILAVYVEPSNDALADGQTLTLATSETPDWLQVQIPEKLLPSEMLDLTIISEPVLTARSGEFTLHTSLGTWKDSKRIRVNVVAPEPWPLPAGFEPAVGTDLVRAGGDGRVFYRNIVRVINAELPVNFILIYPPENSSATSKTTPPFYMMENKVWNALFEQYWLATGAVDPHSSASADWKDGATAGAAKLDAISHPNLPVVRVTAYIAHQFAIWLGGENVCHLPSIDQWDMASGLPHWQGMTSDQRAEYPVGPFRGPWIEGTTKVCVNRRQLGPQPVGESSDDVTITGCRDMAGNVLELTDFLMGGSRVGDMVPGSEGSLQQVLLRGRSYFNSSPLTWDDLRNPKDFAGMTGYDEPDPTIGFRVVLETTK